MEGDELLAVLRDLAREVGLDVRDVRAAAVEDGTPPRSAVCRVYGALYVVLAAGDPVGERICALADGLRRHAPSLLTDRYLPPAVRAVLETGSQRA